jgi:hypothetical protein
MPEHYLANLQNKRLNEVVIPGSHDAGIYTQGKKNVVTQGLNIFLQAMAGVRFFDLRIATHKSGIGPWAKYEQRAYHLNANLVVNSKHSIRRHLPGGDKDVKSHQNVGHLGGWGDSLDTMLDQAESFVRTHPNEFLILKFSKSYGLENIVEACLTKLGNYHYNPRTKVNLNMMQVKSFGGKVITLFAEKDLAKLNLPNADHKYSGLLPFRELYDSDTGACKVYNRFFNGLQYYGKFSSTDSIDKNTQKQRATMERGAMGADRDAMGMMYWTTTGLFGDIQKRNAKMWSVGNNSALQQTWTQGLEASIRSQMGRDFTHARQSPSGKIAKWGGGGVNWKAFMPNIVMMDFSDDQKCTTIQALNDVASQQVRQYLDLVGDLLGDD